MGLAAGAFGSVFGFAFGDGLPLHVGGIGGATALEGDDVVDGFHGRFLL